MIDVRAEPEIVRHSPVAATIDAKGDLGPCAAQLAVTTAIDAASLFGVGVVSVRGANHLGLLATYVERAALAGFICILTSTTEAMVHAPHSTEALLGTNPLAIGVPLGPGIDPLVLDMATSVVSMGEIIRRAAAGESIEVDWGMDDTGKPALDAASLSILSTFGGEKGYGLSLALGVITSMLAGTPYGADVRGTLDTTNPATKGDLVVCIDPGAFGAPDAAASEYLDRIRNSRTDGRGRPFIPGDRSRSLRTERIESGIPLDSEALAFVLAAGQPA
jgi:LDH2 family malate/lactate/ureidoglycolate dehydrogenase